MPDPVAAPAASIVNTPLPAEPAIVVETKAPEPVVEKLPAKPLYEPEGADAPDKVDPPPSGEPDKPGEPPKEDPSKPGDDPSTPPKYEFKFPEGMVADQETLSTFEATAKELNLPADKAQALVDLHVKGMEGYAQAFIDAQAKASKELTDGWKAELAKDPEFSGDNLTANLRSIGKAIDEYGTPALREALDLTGAGDHPEVVRFISKMAKALAEGSIAPTGRPASRKPSGSAALYPSMQEH